jgi:hypothetical protein
MEAATPDCTRSGLGLGVVAGGPILVGTGARSPAIGNPHEHGPGPAIPEQRNVHEFRPKPADTEKITINLGYVDLGHVD